MKNNTPETDLRTALERHGAREYEIVALTMVPIRGLAALKAAEDKKVEHPIAYAIALFDNPEWYPSGEVHRRGTNQHADAAPPMPPVQRERNLAEARKILAMLKGEK